MEHTTDKRKRPFPQDPHASIASPKGLSPHFLECLSDEYNAVKPSALPACESLARKTEDLIRENGIQLVFPVEWRIKGLDSIVLNAEHRRTRHKNSLKDIIDFAGLRFVVLFQRDVQAVCRLLKKHFEVVREANMADRLSETQFGYASIHLNTRLSGKWLDQPTTRPLEGYGIEFQVRSLAQHLWAVTSHQLQYKQEHDVPPVLRRSLHRASALLETVDLEFDRILTDRGRYTANITRTIPSGSLNIDLLKIVLEQKLSTRWRSGTDTEELTRLLLLLNRYGISTTTALLDLIKNQYGKTLRREKKILSRLLAQGASKHLPDGVQDGQYFTRVGFIRQMLDANASPLIHNSPDGQWSAIIARSTRDTICPGRHGYDFAEHKVRIVSNCKRTLATYDFSSKDGNHGRFVESAGWSPDSGYFVFSTSSSGGHSPWQYATFVYSIVAKSLKQIHGEMGPIVRPEFTFVGPHDVRFSVLDSDPSREAEMFPAKDAIVSLPSFFKRLRNRSRRGGREGFLKPPSPSGGTSGAPPSNP